MRRVLAIMSVVAASLGAGNIVGALGDPAGDAIAPEFDLIEATFGGSGSTVAASATFDDPPILTQWQPGFDSLEWQIDVDGDAFADHFLRIAYDGNAVAVTMRAVNGVQQTYESCGLLPDVDQLGTTVTVALTTACFGSPTTYRWRAVMERYESPDFHIDAVPDTGWSAVVNVETGGGGPGGGSGGGVRPSVGSVVTVDPARLVDTRPLGTTVDGLYAGDGTIGAGQTRAVRIAGRGNVPVGAAGAIVNATATSPQGVGYLTLFRCGTAPPNSSNVNYAPGQTVANAAIVKLAADGTVCVYAEAATEFILDVTGYTKPASTLSTLEPARLVDTRVGGTTSDGRDAGVGAIGSGSVFPVVVAGRGGVPGDATTAVLNATVTQTQGPGYVTLFPCGTTPPNSSTVNYPHAGDTVANTAVVKLAADGTVCVYAKTGTEFVLDVTGSARAAGDLGSLEPARLVDTRDDGTTIDGRDAGLGRVVADGVYRLQVAGRGGVPAGAATAMLNVTAVNSRQHGYLTVYPCDDVPNASSINYGVGSVVANLVVTNLSADGDVCIYSLQTTDILVDVNGHAT